MRDDDGNDPTLEIDPSGTARVSARGQKLRTLSGRWRALPHIGELLILCRADDRPAAGKGIALCGEIDTPGALTNVLNFLHLSLWDGTLTVVSGKARKVLYYGRGQLLSATSNVPDERLGALLVRFGMIEQDDLLHCVRQVTEQRRLGTVLIEHGLMTAHDLYEGVRRQCEEIFFSTLLLRRGAFYFVKEVDESRVTTRLHLDTQTLLLEGLRRIDEMSFFRVHLPSPQVLLARREPPPAVDLPDAAAGIVYADLDEPRSLAQVARRTRLGEFQATKGAFQLLQTGFIEARVPELLERPRPVPGELLPEGADALIVEAYNGAFRRLHATLTAKGKDQQLTDGTAAFLAQANRFGDLFRDLQLLPDGALSAPALLANISSLPNPDRLDLLQRGLTDLLFFLLFIAGDSVEGDDQRDLHEQVAVALEMLPRRTNTELSNPR
jgi:hypothetical protein